MQASMTWINASTTKSTKDGDPEKYARNWESRSNADTNSLPTWVGLRAAHRRKAAVAATTATARQPVTADRAGASMVKIGLRYGAGKLTKLKQISLNWLTLNMLPPTNIKLSPPTSKIHRVDLNNFPMTIGRWRHKTARRNDKPKNMSATPFGSWHNGKAFS